MGIYYEFDETEADKEYDDWFAKKLKDMAECSTIAKSNMRVGSPVPANRQTEKNHS